MPTLTMVTFSCSQHYNRATSTDL